MDANVVLVISAAISIVFACLMVRRMQLGEMATLRREGRHHVFRLELRRRVEMRSHADGMGGHSYPEPAETRILIWHFCALPVWSRTESIGLPTSCESQIDDIRAEDFDQHFTPAFKLASQPGSLARRSSHTANA